MLLSLRDTKETKATKILRQKAKLKKYKIDNRISKKNNFTFLLNIFMDFVDNSSFYLFLIGLKLNLIIYYNI